MTRACDASLGDPGGDRTLDDALHDPQLCEGWLQSGVAGCDGFTVVFGHGIDTARSLYYRDDQLVAIVRYGIGPLAGCEARSATFDEPLCSGGHSIPLPLCRSKP